MIFPCGTGTTQTEGFGSGALLTGHALNALEPDAAFNQFLIRYRTDTDQPAATARLTKLVTRAQLAVLGPQRPTDVANFERVRQVPLALAALLGFVGLAAIAHTLTMSVRRRTRD